MGALVPFERQARDAPFGDPLREPPRGWLIGITLAWTAAHPGLPPAVRLFIVTGFLGGLTTFSTFSAESVGLILKGMVGPAFLHAGLHLGGSLLACFAGVKTGQWIRAVLGG